MPFRKGNLLYVQGRDGGEDGAEPKPVDLQDREEEFSTSLHSLGINDEMTQLLIVNDPLYA